MPVQAAKWALLIGVDHYDDKSIISLGGAAADARALKETLVLKAGFPRENITLLTTDASAENGEKVPTRSNILTALARMGKNVQPGDLVFVLYSGHGMELDGVPCLLPCDITNADETTLEASSLRVSDFREPLNRLKAKALILAFDMCRSNPISVGKSVAGSDNLMSDGMARSMDWKQKAVSTGGPDIAVTLYACSPNQRSWEGQGRGYFSYYLEKGLSGEARDKDGAITVLSLADYVTEQVKREVQLKEQKEQVPYRSLSGVGASSLVLIGNAKTAPSITDASVSGEKPSGALARLSFKVNAPNAKIQVAALSGSNTRFTPVRNGVYLADLQDEEQRDVQVKITADGYEGQLFMATLQRGKTITVPVTLEVATNASHAPEPASNTSNAGGTPEANPSPNPAPASTPFSRPVTLEEYKEQMITIPDGDFLMGDNGGRREDAKPAHLVHLSEYKIGRTPVTVGMYEEFCQAKRRVMPAAPTFNRDWQDKTQPIVNVTWDEAKDYCRWAGLSLPTEAQWEKAARGTKAYLYPWGNDWDPSRLCNGLANGANGTRPVGWYPRGASVYGCLDMAGNVWQWCEDTYTDGFYATPAATRSDPLNRANGPYRVLRGGSWYDSYPIKFTSTYRNSSNPVTRSNSNGFRAIATGM